MILWIFLLQFYRREKCLISDNCSFRFGDCIAFKICDPIVFSFDSYIFSLPDYTFYRFFFFLVPRNLEKNYAMITDYK